MNKPWVWVLMGCTTAIICTVLVIVAINWIVSHTKRWARAIRQRKATLGLIPG
jgi:hypothetical protein